MPPETGPTYELSNGTCRLCLEHKEELIPLECALSETELINVIDCFLKIDITDNWPFQNVCDDCVMQVRLIEKLRAHFDERNRIFDVLWTQYKRIHMQADGAGGSSKKKSSKTEESNVNSGYVIEGMVIEKTEVEILPPDMLLKAEARTEQCGAVIKQEENEEEDHLVEELVYEELTLDETELDEGEIIEEDKDTLEGEHEGEMVEEHIMEPEEDVIAAEDESDDQIEHQLYEIADSEDGEQKQQQEQQQDDCYYDETVSRCYICMETLESESVLQEHLGTVHLKLLPFHCDKCLQYYRTIDEVNQHLISHEYPFVCMYCPRKYSSERQLENHNKDCNTYRCLYCPAEFEVLSHLNTHKRQHAAQLRGKLKCKACGRQFTQSSHLKRHLRSGSCVGAKERGPKRKYMRRQGQEIPTSPRGGDQCSKEPQNKNLLYCQVCDRKFVSNSYLARHFERDHSELRFPLFPCDVCTKKFTSFEKSVLHRRYHRRQPAIKPKELKKPKETVCKICDKEFRVDHQLLRHLTEEHSLALELFQCDQCPRKFSTEFKLRKHHYNSHRENKTLYVCSHCGQKFEKKLTLKDHETKHLGMPAYRCAVCDKTFIHKHSLDRHALVHSDEKQFACEFCAKTFKRNTTLVIHRRIHTGEKPYQCEPCGMRFIDSSTLIKHRQRAHMKAECMPLKQEQGQ
uniref:C2H2-type domain-containing protein n=1 Tax=Anopheles arabiensis TaxID=7173 RepID=A0A182HT35_ANOAR